MEKCVKTAANHLNAKRSSIFITRAYRGWISADKNEKKNSYHIHRIYQGRKKWSIAAAKVAASKLEDVEEGEVEEARKSGNKENFN